MKEKTISDLSRQLMVESGRVVGGFINPPLPGPIFHSPPIGTPIPGIPPSTVSSVYDGHELNLPISRHAASFLDEAVSTMKQRASQRDAGDNGERSMAKTTDIFNAWTGNNISVEDGWRFMIALKLAREVQGSYHADDYVDLAAYASLLGEEESGNPSRQKK